LPPKTPTQPGSADAGHKVMALASRGWRLFPIPGRQKQPRMKKWQDRATNAPEQLQAWLRESPDCNWGLATGVASGIFVLDVDDKSALGTLETLGSLPQTYTTQTARGWHYYFQYPAGEIRNSAGKLGTGLDVRGEGGYVIVPPSIHPTGAIYTLLHDLPIAQAPRWLLKKLQGQSSEAPPAATLPTTSKAAIPQGQRNGELASLAGTMQRRGMSLAAIEAALLAENETRCSPPLPESEVRAIARSICRYEPKEGQDEDGLLIVGERPFAQMVPDGERLLKRRPEERIFQTALSRRLVRIIQHSQDPHPERGVRRDPQANVMVAVDTQYLQLALGRTGKICKQGKNGPVPIDAPRSLADMMLASVETSSEMTTWDRLKKISLTPILQTDGTIVIEEGYNAASNIWINTRGITFTDPAAHKPKLSAKECRALIERDIHPIACEYPFAKEHPAQEWYETAAWAVVLSGLMSVDDRHNLPTVHMHCISAPAQGSGKTKLVQAISAAITGTLPSIVTYDGAEEFGKFLPVLIGHGDPVICIDNVIMSINNAKLAAALTQEHSMTYRVLGSSADRTIENSSVLFVTGNNLQLSGDMPRRCLLCRVEPAVERPEQQKFPFDPVKRAMEFFPRAVMAVKAVLRAHQLAGYPGVRLLKGESGSFPEWDRRVRAAIAWMGYADPLITQDSIRADDPGRKESVEALWILGEAFGQNVFQVFELTQKLTLDAQAALMQTTGHKFGEPFNTRKVGRYFATHLAGRWFEGHRLTKTGRTPHGRDEWKVEMKQEEEAHHGKEEPL
jgi:hypothetical protein